MLRAVLDFFDFSRLPFSKGLTPKDAFPTSSHTEALARLQYGIGSEDFLLLTGPVGVGKSVALLALIHSLDPNAYSPIYVRGNSLGEGELSRPSLPPSTATRPALLS